VAGEEGTDTHRAVTGEYPHLLPLLTESIHSSSKLVTALCLISITVFNCEFFTILFPVWLLIVRRHFNMDRGYLGRQVISNHMVSDNYY
jgi:hypothetical protein